MLLYHLNTQLLDCLRKYRCLVILDDVQTINSSGQLAGNYQLYRIHHKLIGKVYYTFN